MKAITVHGIDPSLAEKLKQAAKEKGKSVNQFILETLKESLGIEKQKRFTVQIWDLIMDKKILCKFNHFLVSNKSLHDFVIKTIFAFREFKCKNL